MSLKAFTIFHDSGYHESKFEITTIWARNPLDAAKQAAKVSHCDNGDYTFYVVATDEVTVLEAKIPQSQSFTTSQIVKPKMRAQQNQ